MRFSSTELFASINPYRDWFLVLMFLILAAVGVAVLDARFFLSATRDGGGDSKQFSSVEFDKKELVRATTMLQEKEQRFNALRR
ncbi:hypothetical protein K8Q93_01215 [Candidatus Parcubacteria bacterium]|nr:hypothetical protein [Candidatus Parcubacteria bacterium]